jgi:hypothetical protein
LTPSGSTYGIACLQARRNVAGQRALPSSARLARRMDEAVALLVSARQTGSRCADPLARHQN